MSGKVLGGMGGKTWRVARWIGIVVVPLVLVVAFVLGLSVEGVILVGTVVLCSLSLIPLVVDRHTGRGLDETAVTHGT